MVKMKEIKFKYVLDGKEIDKEFIDWNRNPSVNVENDTVFINYLDGQQKFISQIEEYQEKNKGILKFMEFPLDFGGEKIREDLNSKFIIYTDLEKYRRKKDSIEITKTKEDVLPNNNKAEKEMIDYLQGVKESDGKLNYELDWGFIQQMAERMSQNKGKYPPYNWMLPMDVEKLKQSLFRHVIEIMKGSYSDDGREFGHLESVALNALMINFQLKNLQD